MHAGGVERSKGLGIISPYPLGFSYLLPKLSPSLGLGLSYLEAVKNSI